MKARQVVAGLVVAAGVGAVTTGCGDPDDKNGWASRYWDCCKPHCAWSQNVSGGNPVSSCDAQNQSLGSNYSAASSCDGGNAFMCYGYAPWAASDQLAYGFAAHNSGACGRCFELRFTGSSHNAGNDPGSASLNGKKMVVQVINRGGLAGNQFDLLIPGGGVGVENGCTTQWGTSDLGAQYGGFLAGCSGSADRASCVLQKCQTVFGAAPELMAGCNWFITWYALADNPNLVFKEVSCPSAITAVSGMSG